MIIDFIPRALATRIIEATEYFPVITLTGPRQSGKSTLLRHLFPDLPYRSLEDPDVRLRAGDDPRGFLSEFKTGVIIDEVQRLPDLLSYIQGMVDIDPKRRFYLTGSAQFALMKTVSQTLAGRTAVFELLPLALDELPDTTPGASVDDLLYTGFYPAVWSGRNIPRLLYPAYTRTYIERDVRDMLAIGNIDAFQRFVRLCAARIGSLFNASELANELGVAVNTVNSWLSVLEASYVVYMLPPFHTNTRKRLTKSRKIYFTDCGLAAWLLDIDSPEVMRRDRMRGYLFENMVVVNALKTLYNAGKTPGLYFYRDSNGNEVDLMVRNGAGYDCFEIKSSETFHPDFIKGLVAFERSFPALTASKSVLYAGPDADSYKDTAIRNYRTAFGRQG